MFTLAQTSALAGIDYAIIGLYLVGILLIGTYFGRYVKTGRGFFLAGRAKHVDVLHYPYWVYYHARRCRAVDIKVLDAVTGAAPGPKVKMSILAALVTLSQSKDAMDHGSATLTHATRKLG